MGTSRTSNIINFYIRAGKRFKSNWSNWSKWSPPKKYISTLLIFSTMNTSQIRFVLALHATWNVLRDPVLTRIYARKWKRALAQLSKTIAPSDRLPSLYGYVFRLMYAECKKYV